jgi:hypothetical protein
VPVFGLWALYRFVVTLFDLNFSPARARVWGKQILRPLILLLIFLQYDRAAGQPARTAP